MSGQLFKTVPFAYLAARRALSSTPHSALVHVPDSLQLTQESTSMLLGSLHHNGFVYLKSPVVSSAVQQRLISASAVLMAISDDRKRQSAWTDTYSNRGFYRVKAGGSDREEVDVFVMGNPADHPAGLREQYWANSGVPTNQWEDSIAQPNRWPSDVEGSTNSVLEVREAMEDYFSRCTQLGEWVLRSVAAGLTCSPESLVASHINHDHTLEVKRFPPVESGFEGVRIGEHVDFCTLTLLAVDEMGGLMERQVDGTLHAARSEPDTVLMHTGDILDRFTASVCPSTRHLVCAPSHPDATSRFRYTTQFFMSPNRDEVVEPVGGLKDKRELDQVLGSDVRLKRKEAVVCGDHVQQRHDTILARSMVLF